jgi:PmbA protein
MMKTELQNNSVSGLKSIDSCQEILKETLALCLGHGATDACVDFGQDIGFNVDVRLSEVESVSFHQNQSVSIEVFIGQRKGIASSSDLRLESIQRAVKVACDMAKVSAIDTCYGLENFKKSSNTQNLDLYHPADFNTEQAIIKAKELEALARQQDKRIANSEGASVSSYRILNASMNTKGFEEVLYSTRHSMSCVLIGKQNDEMQRDYAFTTARALEDLDSIQDLAQLTASRVCSRLGAKPIPTQEVPVIFSQRISAGLIGALISGISGAQLYRKNSFLCDSLGKKILPDFVNIQEKPFIPKGLGSSHYDSDGVATRENIFVQNGVIAQYVLGVYSARRLGLQSSGNADGVHNLHVSANALDLQELMQAVPKCFVVTELMGHGAQMLTGDFSQGASGFWVENGQIQHAVEGVTIAGNLLDIYQDIIGIGADFDHNRSTQCGSILIKKMMVAGR